MVTRNRRAVDQVAMRSKGRRFERERTAAYKVGENVGSKVQRPSQLYQLIATSHA